DSRTAATASRPQPQLRWWGRTTARDHRQCARSRWRRCAWRAQRRSVEPQHAWLVRPLGWPVVRARSCDGLAPCRQGYPATRRCDNGRIEPCRAKPYPLAMSVSRKKPAPSLARWRVIRIKKTPAVEVGTVEATDAESAIKAAIERFGI